MRTVLTLSASVVVFAVVASVLADNSVQPDLSGTWVLNASKSRPATLGASDVATVTPTGQVIEESHLTTNGKDSEQAYIVDGKEVIAQPSVGRS